MHLLVLSAFRRTDTGVEPGHSYVSMHLLVLSAFRPEGTAETHILLYESQCTFWCSVLSDLERGSIMPSLAGLNAPFGAQCFPTPQYGPVAVVA